MLAGLGAALVSALGMVALRAAICGVMTWVSVATMRYWLPWIYQTCLPWLWDQVVVIWGSIPLAVGDTWYGGLGWQGQIVDRLNQYVFPFLKILQHWVPVHQAWLCFIAWISFTVFWWCFQMTYKLVVGVVAKAGG